ncbi:MAG: GNAT family N-acetyltransferase [Flammeovirgaceae bacterium]|nr:GNAT family N-acetyltransferase [Flammeovirgaceae bacterium]
MAKRKKLHLELRKVRLSDYDDIVEIMQNAYSNIGGVWSKQQIEKLTSIFPEGQIGIEDKGKLIAFALTIIVNYDDYPDDHDYPTITGDYTFSTHDPDGNVLYGIEICVHSDYRSMRLGRRIYDARKELCEKLNLESIVAGGRMPNFYKYSKKLEPKEYIAKVKEREIYDPVLSFQMSNDFHVKKILTGYLPQDIESKAYATLIEWNNIYFKPRPKMFGGKKHFARIGVVQWQMRNVTSLKAFFDYVEFFVDSVSDYGADFILLPEFINMPMIAEFNEMDSASSIRKLAEYTTDIRNKFSELAVYYNINVIAGSLPEIENGKLYNVSYLCRRNGTYEKQYKIHITPSEAAEWGITGGSKVIAFDTDVAKIGILICYDAEFPELGRLLADQGMQILFVPFATDMNSAYQRVRICSQARAIENECYVAIAGSVGNLPRVRNMDIHYAQSAVFSPSDIAFPTNGIVKEGVPNTEQVIIADVDLDDLKDLHNHGSVNTLKDRRKDLYELKIINPAG